jgi:hypothetical protein
MTMVTLAGLTRGTVVRFHPNRKVKNVQKDETLSVVLQGKEKTVLRSFRTGRFLTAPKNIRAIFVAAS